MIILSMNMSYYLLIFYQLFLLLIKFQNIICRLMHFLFHLNNKINIRFLERAKQEIDFKKSCEYLKSIKWCIDTYTMGECINYSHCYEYSDAPTSFGLTLFCVPHFCDNIEANTTIDRMNIVYYKNPSVYGLLILPEHAHILLREDIRDKIKNTQFVFKGDNHRMGIYDSVTEMLASLEKNNL